VAEQEGKRLFELLPFLDLITGPGRLPEIPGVLERRRPGGGPVVLTGESALPEGSPDELSHPLSGARGAPPASLLTIMEGCENFCAYCVVPYVRGPERSRGKAEVLREARSLIAAGAKDITLLGQNVNSYRPPGDSRRSGLPFVELLGEAALLPGLLRLRFTTSHPTDFPPELCELFRTPGALAPHVHLPLQSGSDRVLAAMGRGYTYERYLSIAESLRAARPEAALTTDVILGFPGETEKDFELTLRAAREIRFDSLFSFRYSGRPGARSEALPDKVPEEAKRERLEELVRVQKGISAEINQRLLGTVQEVLPEGFGRVPGQLSGRAGNGKVVNFQGPAELIGSPARVRITRTGPVSLLGELAGGEEAQPKPEGGAAGAQPEGG
jgi:tRNA-2-methylthio-N6-dimethylallyladenosine synthase